MPRLLHPGTLVQCDFHCHSRGAGGRESGLEALRGKRLQSCRARGKTLYRAGVAALDAATGHLLHEGDVDAQAECAYGRVLELISAGGGRRTTS